MVDNESVDSTIAANTAAAEAPSSAAPSQDSGQAGPIGSGDAEQTAPDTGTQPANDATRSLTSQTGPQNTEQVPQKTDWERRYHEQAKGLGKIQSELGHLRKYKQEVDTRYKDIDPQTVEAWRQQKALAEQKQLPKWHKNNPDRPMFQQQYAEYRRLQSAYQRAKNPEAQEALVAELEQFPQDVRQAFGDFQKHQRTVNERIAEELTGYNSIEEMFESKFQEKFAEQQARLQAEQKVNQWFDTPAHQPYVEHTRDAMAEALREGVPLPYVQRMAEMQYKLDVLESRQAGPESVVAASQARTQAAKQNAAITRDTPTGGRKADPVAIARERNIELGSSSYVHLLSELHSKNLL